MEAQGGSHGAAGSQEWNDVVGVEEGAGVVDEGGGGGAGAPAVVAGESLPVALTGKSCHVGG